MVACGQVFSLYVLDAEFWGGAGAQLCESIREFDPLAPIILYSPAAGSGVLPAAPEACATHHVLKSDLDGLIEAVHGVASVAAGEPERAGFAARP
jgi:hypothetical protein